MFTIEMDWDETALTILDDTGRVEDVQVFMYEDVVYIRQWVEKENRFQIIQMTPLMLEEFRRSFKYPEGAYLVDVGQ
jgi:hypothetical protein